MQEKSSRRPNKARSASTRAALIAAARQLFVENGYGATGTPEIVAAASVTRGALYHHFADKAALFRAVVMEEARAVATQIERETADSTVALEALMAGADAYFAAMAAPGRVRLLLVEGPSVLGREEIDRIDREAGAGELREGLAYAMTAGALPSVPLDALTDLISAAFDRAALAIAEGKPAGDYRAAIRLILASMIGNAGRPDQSD